NDSLHQSELAVEGDAFRRCQGLAILVENSDGLAAVAGEPGVVIGVDSCAEGAALHSASGKPGGDRRQRPAVRGEFGRVTLPQCVARLPTDGEVVTDPEVAFAVEHRFAAGAITAPVKLER